MTKAKKLAAFVASAFISVCFLFGCGCAKDVAIESGEIMQDINVKPTQQAAYEEYTKQVLDDYFAVANKHIVGGDIDISNEEVIQAAKPTAAKLYAYACYNERRLDKYVYFSAQEGETDISAGSAAALRQEFFLRVNESEDTCGYRYHYTIKMVERSEGSIGMFKSAFESARTRITDETDLLYRLEGDNIRMGEYNEILGVDMLTCDWKTGDDWGKHDAVMQKSDYIEPEKIEEDIVTVAGEDNVTIHGNINVLAENMVKSATIIPSVDDDGVLDGYLIVMIIDTEVANQDEASLKMLRRANSSDNREWVNDEEDEESSGLSIVFRIWENGLFRTYTIAEKWKGKISGFSGVADSSTVYYYSYSDRDCDMTPYLNMLEQAKAAKGE